MPEALRYVPTACSCAVDGQVAQALLSKTLRNQGPVSVSPSLAHGHRSPAAGRSAPFASRVPSRESRPGRDPSLATGFIAGRSPPRQHPARMLILSPPRRVEGFTLRSGSFAEAGRSPPVSLSTPSEKPSPRPPCRPQTPPPAPRRRRCGPTTRRRSRSPGARAQRR